MFIEARLGYRGLGAQAVGLGVAGFLGVQEVLGFRLYDMMFVTSLGRRYFGPRAGSFLGF